MACEKCGQKAEKEQQQLDDHQKAVKVNHDNLQRENVQLHAQVNHYKKEHEAFKVATKSKLEQTIRIYDKANADVVSFLELSGLSNEDVNQVKNMVPLKL